MWAVVCAVFGILLTLVCGDEGINEKLGKIWGTDGQNLCYESFFSELCDIQSSSFHFFNHQTFLYYDLSAFIIS